MNYFASMDEANNISREAVRSAVILAKLRYEDQLAPFVRTSKERLDSSLIQSEVTRIANECAEETGADPERVLDVLQKIIADVVIPVTTPERVKLDTGPGSVPPDKDGGDVEPQGKTDVLDHGAVLEDEILEPANFKRVDIETMACVRCASANVAEGSLVCERCETALVAKAKKKESVAWAPSTPGQVQTPQMGGGQPTTPMIPLNNNAPYQCVVCGRTGTFDDVKNHLDTAVDVDHMRAKSQQQPQPGAVPPAGTPPQAPTTQPTQQYAHTAGEYEKKEDDPAETATDTDTSVTPSGHFDDVVQEMANRAAARHFSTPSDDVAQKLADAYGLDANEVKESLQITSNFGEYHAVNGTPGQGEMPEGYTEVDPDSAGSPDAPNQGSGTHEAVVPVNIAVRKTAEDLGMDTDSVYSAIKDAYGDDLSDEYHVSVQGEYHYYLPQSLMEKATNHPDPADQQQQQQQGPQTQPGTAMPQPDTSNLPQYASHFKLNEDQLEVLLTRDGELADQRLARRLTRA